MIQHYSSRYKYITETLGVGGSGSAEILPAGKSYIFYGAILTAQDTSVYFEDADGNLMWAIAHFGQAPSGVSDQRFIGSNGLVAKYDNHSGQSRDMRITVFLSDTGEGAI